MSGDNFFCTEVLRGGEVFKFCIRSGLAWGPGFSAELHLSFFVSWWRFLFDF
jgi:hypothetical protein